MAGVCERHVLEAGHCGRKRDAFTTVSNTVALQSATVAHTAVYHQTAPWTVVAADLY